MLKILPRGKTSSNKKLRHSVQQTCSDHSSENKHFINYFWEIIIIKIN